MAAAAVYWQGPIDGERSWSASDNTVGGSGGSYWNTAANGSGTWQRTPVNENAHVNNGGTVVIDGTVGVVGDVQKLVLDINSNKASCVRIDAGGVLTNAIAYIGHNQGSSGSRFHVNGGEAWLGRGNGGEGFHLPSSQAWRDGGSEYFATVSGGLLDVTGQFTIGAKATTTYLNRGMLTVEGGAVTSHCQLVVGTDSATSVNSGLINVTGGELAVVDGNVLSLYRNARLRQTGGHLVADALAVKRGVAEFRGGSATVGLLKFLSDGTVVVSDEGDLTAGRDLGYDTTATNIANSLIVSNGGVVSSFEFRAGGYLIASANTTVSDCTFNGNADNRPMCICSYCTRQVCCKSSYSYKHFHTFFCCIHNKFFNLIMGSMCRCNFKAVWNLKLF